MRKASVKNYRVQTFSTVIRSAAVGIASILTACGGGGGGSPQPPAPTFTIGGTVSGLAGTGLVLQNNGGNSLAVAANGSFAFTGQLTNGAAYSVTVATQPSNVSQNCIVANGSGSTANLNVTN